MAAITPSRLQLRFTGPLLAVLVAGYASLLPNNAAAACGDWLAHSPQPQQVERRSFDRERTPCPCQSGECRRDGSQVPFAPPDVPKLSVDRSACLGRSLAMGDEKRERIAIEQQLGEPKIVPFVPERPPRV